MRRPPFVLAGWICCLLAPLAPAQTLTAVPQDLATAEVAFMEAEDAWLHADPALERDLHKVSPAEAHRRIDSRAALANEAMEKRQVYLGLLISRTGQLRSRLAELGAGNLPVEKMKGDLEQDQTRILGEQDSVEEMIREFPGEENVLVRRHLEEERNRLINLQNNIARQIRTLNNLQSDPGALRRLLEKQQTDLDAILKDYNDEREASIRRRGDYARLYSEMHLSVDAASRAAAPATAKSGSSKPAKGTAGAAKNSSVPVKGSPAPAKGSPAPAKTEKSSPLAGAWVYRSQPNGWTGFAEPGTVTLELHDEGSKLRGSYSARLPVKSGVHEVQLTLEGSFTSANSAKLHWRSVAPAAEGELTVKLAGDGRLLIERIQSGDSFVPVGSEVLSRK